MRNLVEVIDNIIEEIPFTEGQLLDRLQDQKNSICYAAPEMIGFWWNQVADTLWDEIGEPTLDWQIKVAKIFSGTE